jgi:acetoin utilization protein AcuB
MNVWYWMTKKIFVVSPDDYLADAMGLMKEQKVKHLPVLKNGKLKGIISDRDIKDYSPSKATSLDIYELHYLLAKTKIKQIMKTKVIYTTPDTPIEISDVFPWWTAASSLASSRIRTSSAQWWT